MVNFFRKLEPYSLKHHCRMKQICRPLTDLFSVNHFFYQYVTSNGEFNAFGSHLDLFGYYYEDKLHSANPFIHSSDSVKTGVYIMDSVVNNEYQESLRKLQTKFNSNYYLLINKKEQHCSRQFGFCIPQNEPGLKLLLINNIPLLRSFVDYFETQMAHSITELHHNPVDINGEIPCTPHSKEIGFSDIELAPSKVAAFYAQILDASRHGREYRFTSRELDCIPLLLSGKTAFEISQCLQLSRRTVEHHLANLKDKLQCRTKSELIHQLLKLSKN